VDRPIVTVEGNEAAAYVAHKLSEVIAIYPITPSSGMGEMADAWSSAGRTNLWRNIPSVVEMQSEAGAAGACHGAIQAGALTATFTASQGLLLMIPNMYKIAGELSAGVIHVTARSIATHALSIFADHSDVMAVRQTGYGLLASVSVQEAQDMAAVAHAASLATRVPFLHFFDGFRTSHEVAKIERLTDDDLMAMMDPDAIAAHRARAMDPEHPVLRGTAQNPDPDAERVVMLMTSGVGAALEAVERLTSEGEKVGVVVVRLYRPFARDAFLSALPKTVKGIAVLDRTKEPGALGEPLYQDVITTVVEAASDGTLHLDGMPKVIGGRYGLSSKEFTPAMVKAALDEVGKDDAKVHFTLGIVDDLTHLSLVHDEEWDTGSDQVVRALFFGLGADGTVGANKNSVKIIGEHTPMHAQGYFVYDSKKSGAMTVSHLRFGDEKILSSYLIDKASFVACHQFSLMEKVDVLSRARMGAKFLLNSPYGVDGTWDRLPVETQQQMIDKKIEFYIVDGYGVAKEAGLGGRINTVLQTCFFGLAGILPADEAIQAIKDSITKTYGKRGETVLKRNFDAVDASMAALHRLEVPAEATSTRRLRPAVPEDAPDFVKRVTAMIIDGKGDLLPVSALPVDGTFPTATTQYEKRTVAMEIPIWDPEICTDCARCSLVCPHAAIRVKYFDPADLEGAPESFLSREPKGKDSPASLFTIQVAPDDCTGCGVCVSICPGKSKEEVKHKAINMMPLDDHLETERANYEFFLDLPEVDRTTVNRTSLKGSQALRPLFEYSGACAGCGETPYVKLASQLFGDRMIIGNATGCSSIYGGNLPTTPWAMNDDGRGPTWSNSLFEDNAEFGLGMRLAIDQREQAGLEALADVADIIGDELIIGVANADQTDEQGIADQRDRVAAIRGLLEADGSPRSKWALSLLDSVIRKSVWAMGGDGWAYDIGFGGLDHVFATGRDVNILVLDTEVYSNTGGQASKATPRAAIAKFASGGKTTGKKDLGMIAMAYGTVYVAQIAMGANMLQTVRAFNEAESYPGPSLIIAYSPCIAHGIDMANQMEHQKDAVATGYWPLYRFDPRMAASEESPFKLDSRPPTKPFVEFANTEARFSMLSRVNPERADVLIQAAQEDITERRRLYEQLAGIERGLPGDDVNG
jgi:pyruvate-ferredoxin/flavodoxin oxidoreductase